MVKTNLPSTGRTIGAEYTKYAVAHFAVYGTMRGSLSLREFGRMMRPFVGVYFVS